jgi:hypothetical protein
MRELVLAVFRCTPRGWRRRTAGTSLLATLVLSASCSPDGTSSGQLPEPFDQLTGIALGLTTDSLIKLRPNAQESEVRDFSDSLPPWSLTFRPRLGWLTGLGLAPSRIKMIAAFRPVVPGDTAPGGLRRLLKEQPGDEITCALRVYYPDTLLVWSRVSGDNEFSVMVNPQREIRHRDGVDTATATTNVVWQRPGADREYRIPTRCPDTTTQS